MGAIGFTRGVVGLCKAVARDDSRPALTRVLLKNGWAYAAAGFHAMRLRLPNAAWEGQDPAAEAFVPGRDLGAAAQKLQTGAMGSVAQDGEKIAISVLTTKGRTETVEYAEPELPALDFDSLWNDWTGGSATAHVAVNPRRLSDLMDWIIAAGVRGDAAVVLALGKNPSEPLRVLGRDDDGRPVEAVLMPMCLDGQTGEHGKLTWPPAGAGPEPWPPEGQPDAAPEAPNEGA